jgi:hypothetical protein
MNDNKGDTGKTHACEGGVCQFVELSDGGWRSFGREIFLSRRRTTQNVGQGASDKKSDGDAADNSHAVTSRSNECKSLRVETPAIVSEVSQPVSLDKPREIAPFGVSSRKWGDFGGSGSEFGTARHWAVAEKMPARRLPSFPRG